MSFYYSGFSWIGREGRVVVEILRMAMDGWIREMYGGVLMVEYRVCGCGMCDTRFVSVAATVCHQWCSTSPPDGVT